MATINVSSGGNLQSAINAAASGDTLNLLGDPASGSISISKPLTIIGNGFTLDGQYTHPTSGSQYGCSLATVNGIQAFQRVTSSLVSISNVNGVTIDGLNVTRSRGEGIRQDFCQNVTIENLEVYSNRARGLVAADSSNVTYYNLDVYDNMNFYPHSRSASVCNWGAASTMI